MKKVLKIILFIILLLILAEGLICNRTYWIPSLKVFLRYQFVYNDSTALKHCQIDSPVIKAPNLDKSPTVCYNYYSEKLLKARFAKPYSKNIDYIAMINPDCSGCYYYINPETRVLYHKQLEVLGYNAVLSSNTNSVFNEIVPVKNNVFHYNPPYIERWFDRFYEDGVLRPEFICIINDRGVVFSDFAISGVPPIIKAHLWHLFIDP